MVLTVIIVVVVVVDYLTGKYTGGGVATGRTVGVVEDELSTSKYWLC